MSVDAAQDTQTPRAILVVDDEKNIRLTLEWVLQGEGFLVRSAGTAEEALGILGEPHTPVELVILDLKLPGMSGVAALEQMKRDEATREIPVLVVSGHASASEAVDAIRKGAVDFLEKPLLRERVLVAVRNALEASRAKRTLERYENEMGTRYEMVGESPQIRKLISEIERVAPTRAGVLITGESGTGKELISRALHRLSPRAKEPFIKVNCAAIPRDLIESELFGHERGAFTGANARKRGVFEQAHGGTLFLDEIGDMDLLAQAKVLRALQSGEVSRVGSEHVLHVDVRILAATNKDLTRAVESGAFREDLFFRLNVVPIRSPSLRERPSDIPLLVNAFMQSFARENGVRQKEVDSVVVRALSERPWPGNIRELRNVVERMSILSGERVTVADLPEDPHASPFADDENGPLDETAKHPLILVEGEVMSLRAHREFAERNYLLDVLRGAQWNISKAAVLLGVERTNLHKKIRGHGIRRGE
jgi:two-component system, NtrC family, nitrogen regulation response regulator NtrX